jgi:hypothetical protein
MSLRVILDARSFDSDVQFVGHPNLRLWIGPSGRRPTSSFRDFLSGDIRAGWRNGPQAIAPTPFFAEVSVSSTLLVDSSKELQLIIEGLRRLVKLIDGTLCETATSH